VIRALFFSPLQIPVFIYVSRDDLQPFLKKRVRVLGVGPAPIPVKKLTVNRLLTAIAEAENSSIIAAAEATGRFIRAGNGVQTAIHLIEQTKARFTLKKPNL